MSHIKKQIAFLLTTCLLTSNAYSAETNIERETIMTTDKNNAYTIFTTPIISNKMTYYDGQEKGVTDAQDSNYSETIEFDGIEGRKVYRENYIYLQLEEGFAQKGDNEFMVSITYYDFGPDVGYFHLEYNSNDETIPEEARDRKRISVMKAGLVTKWCSTKVYIDDADFNGGLPYNSDLRLVTNAYNAFAKVEITNISASRRDPSIKIGSVNSAKAEVLHLLNLYDGINPQQYVPALDSEMTREEAARAMITALGVDVADTGSCPFVDVSEAFAPYAAYLANEKIVSVPSDRKFNPQAFATKRELLTFYLRALGHKQADLYERALEYAQEEQLIEGSDLIFNIDAPATRDNFVAIAHNALILRRSASEDVLLIDMLNSGKITSDQVKATASAALTAQLYRLPTISKKREIFDPMSGRTINYMNIDGGKAIRPYVTQQHWRPSGKSFIVGSDKTQALYEYNVETEELKMLDYGAVGSSADAVITPNDIMFYRNSQSEIWKMDLVTNKKERVAGKPSFGTNLSVIQVTNDGKYLTSYWKETRSEEDFINNYNRFRIIPRLDSETGIWDSETLSHLFNDDERYPDVGHPIINPEYGDLLFFCHEGTTENIPDRLWIGDYSTGETRNLFIQAEREDGMTGEPSGHEVWSLDGEDMYFVKYTRKENVGQSGIVRISKDGSNREYINGDYTYWHCYPSGDKKWVAADVQMGGARAEVVLINALTYESHLLANFWAPNSVHPYQPHPIMSLDGRMVSWQMVDEDGMLGTAWMDVSDIIDAAPTSKVETISDGLQFTRYTNSVNDVQYVGRNGAQCIKIDMGDELFIDIDDDIVNSDNASIKLKLTYLDTGRQPINITYTTGVTGSKDLANRENAVIRLQRENTGGLITKEIELKDANLANAGKHRTDFKISGFYSGVYIANVEIIEQQK